MYAVTANFRDGGIDLLGFASEQNEVDTLVDRYISRHGADYLGSKGVQFNVELAA